MDSNNDQVLQQAGEAKLELLRRLGKQDLYVFAKYICGFDLMEEQPHRELCDFLMYKVGQTSPALGFNHFYRPDSPYIKENCTGGPKKLVMLARNTFKSTVASIAFPLWLMWNNPNLRIMIDSETLSNAKTYLSAIRDQIHNNKLMKACCVDDKGRYILEPNYKAAGGFTEESLILKQRKKLGMKEPSVFCSGVDNARTGMHPDVIIMDDLVSERNVATPSQIEKVKDHYRFSLSLLEMGGLQLVIGTRYHMADLYNDLMQLDSFDKLIRPAISKDNELHFPTRLTHDFLDGMKKEQGAYIFNCQYMLSPVDESTAIFKKSDIQYTEDYIREHDKYPDIREKYILVDLAISQKERADYTVIMTVGIDNDKKLFVLEYVRKRMLPNETIDELFAAHERHKDKLKMVGLETVSFQKAMLYMVQDEMRKRAVYMRIKELKADKDKIRRIQALQPLFENHDVYISRKHTELENELLEFPYSEHDDCIDAMAYVLQVLRPVSYQHREPLKYPYRPGSRVTNY